MPEIIFADCEGDNFLEDITTLWTIQLAHGVDGDVIVYADQPGYPTLSEGIEVLKNADKVAFHNAFGFDYWAINKLYPGTLRREQMIDTLIISRMLKPSARRHNLGDLGEAVGYPKGSFNDFSKFSEEMVTYGKRDVLIMQKAWKGEHRNPKKSKKIKSFGKLYEKNTKACELEFHTAYVIEKQRQHGFRLDIDGCYELEAELRQESKDIEREVQEIFPPIVTQRYSEKQIDKATGKPKRLKDKVEVFNPGSRQQIGERLIARYDWKPTKKTPTGLPKIDETVLGELDFPEAAPLSRYLSIGKMLGQLADGDNAWLKLYQEDPNGDPRMHGFVNTIGARTTRMSHARPNMGQVSKKDRRMREVWLPDRDHLLVGVDADGLELRMLAHFLYKMDGGEFAEAVHNGSKADETDAHNINKRAAGLYLRDSAKTLIYAFNYGAGDAKLGRIVVADAKAAGMPVPKGSMTSIGKKVRAKLEKGVKGLGDLIGKCSDAHNRRSSLPGLDGRRIESASSHSALNTLLQGNGSIVMKKAVCIADEELEKLQIMDQIGFLDRSNAQAYHCANVHDEFQMSAHPDVAEKVAEVGKWAITRSGEILGVRIPLVGDADIGANWAETH